MCGKKVSEFDKNIGVRLKIFRELKGMSQEKIAELADATYNEIKKYEDGNDQVPYARLMRICEVLGIDLADVVPSEDLSTIFADPEGLIAAIKNKDLNNVMNIVNKKIN